MFNFIHIPKSISKTEFELNKDNYMDLSKKKFEDKFLIYENTLLDNEEESFWLINDIGRSVLKKYGECIYLIIGMDKSSNIELILSNSIDLTNMDYHSKFTASQMELDKLSSTLNQKIKLLKQLFSIKSEILVFNINLDIDFLNSLLKFKFIVKPKNEFEDLLLKTSNIEKGINAYLPYLIVFITTFIIYLMISYFINEYNTKLDDEFTQKEQQLRIGLNNITSKNNILQKEIDEYKNKLSESNKKGTQIYVKKGDL